MTEDTKLVRGDRVIICSSHPGGLHVGARAVIRSLGLVPLVYEGTGLETKKSYLNREIRDDFYSARMRVVFLERGTTGSIANNWALPELTSTPSDRLLIYVSADIPADEIKSLNLPKSPVLITSAEDFEKDIRSQLERLMESA